MIPVLCLNVLCVVLALMLPNEFLMWNSYLLYGVQTFTLLPYLLWRARQIKDIFLPTFFALTYYLINQTLGSFLVPRDYGWNKDYAAVALDVEHYNIIVSFLLIANIVLFLLSARAFSDLARVPPPQPPPARQAQVFGIEDALGIALWFAAFIAVTYFKVYTAFSFQLSILMVHSTYLAQRRRWYRPIVYVAYLLIMVASQFEDKREIIMALFLMIFVETYFGRQSLEFTPRKILLYASALASFFGLVLAASILRGYGDFDVRTLVDAIYYIPQYMSSDLFIDGLTDNLELNYNYGATIASVELLLNGKIHYQYGASLAKIFFLPLPRDLFPIKPENIMQLYTAVYAPDQALIGGSLPVIFPCEMFLNFHYFGLLPFAVIWRFIDRMFVKYHRLPHDSFLAYSCLFLCITILMFARGSGLEHWFLYYLVAAPALLLITVIGRSLGSRISGESRWVV